MALPVGLQVYSLRDELSKDFDGIIKQVASMGYEGVELFGEVPAHAKQLLDGLGLKVAGYHGVYDPLRQDLQKHLDLVLSLGAPTLVCAWSNATPEHGWERITENLEIFAQTAQKQGLTFAYHNHDHELLNHVSDHTVLDYMAANAPTLLFEMDVAWLYAGGVDAADYLRKYASRTALVHMKDVRKTAKGFDTVELGQGEVPLGGILEAAKTTASPWLLAEQDNSDDSLRSARKNLEWLRQH
jgi:sugar phosphate isomerase/epimerase